MAYSIFSSYGLDKINDFESLNREMPNKPLTTNKPLKPTPIKRSHVQHEHINVNDKQLNNKPQK